jgi:parallel beta-helix repeat protein
MTKLVMATIGVGSLLLLPLTAARAASNAPSCGATITGELTLKADLVCRSGHGLVLSGGATLNCGGHRVIGGNHSGQYGIYVRDGANAVVRYCVVEGFEVGIRLRDAHGATVRDSVARDNLRYGIEVTQQSTGAHIEGNQILDNGDEGIHLSGPDDRDAGHEIVDNAIEGNAAEGIYLLMSHGSLIAGNAIRDHGAAGIYVKGSDRNAIDGNTLTNDPLQLVYGSRDNVLTNNFIVGQQIRFKEASNNYVYKLSVRADRGRPSVGYDFIGASDNVIVDSQAANPADYDIRAATNSTNNVFTRFSVPAKLKCSVDHSSSVSVTNNRGVALACGR